MAKLFYENRFILTRKLHKEYCKETYKKMRKTNQRLALILAAVSLILFIVLFIFLYKKKIMILLGTIIGLAFLYFVGMFFFGYAFAEWFNYRDFKRNYGQEQGGEVVYQLRFEPVEVKVKVGKTSLTFKYSTIEKVYETENLFIFILSRDGMIEHGQMIFKKGFTDKSPETLENFKSFINEKAKKSLFEK